MINYASGVNPKIIKWAREKAGYSLLEIAESFEKEVDLIEKWETGEEPPTYNQLEKLAYSLYKRPIALFFYPQPPEEIDPHQSFRTLPDFEIDNLGPDTRYAIRQARAMQIALLELNDALNPSKRKLFLELPLNINNSPSNTAQELREYLGISLAQQVKWKTTEEALETWRKAIQDSGVFVFKRSFKQEDIFGFCLLHEQFPIIYINNSSASTRQIFTLFHELAHILLNTNGITKQNDDYIEHLIGDEKEVEIFCNKFASEFLVPSSDFDKYVGQWKNTDDIVINLSRRYKVSREVILRILLDRNLIDQIDYETKANQWVKEYKEAKLRKRGGGGNYYATHAIYLGSKYINLAFGRYYQGKCTVQQLAGYLNLKVQNVQNFEHHAFGKVSI